MLSLIRETKGAVDSLLYGLAGRDCEAVKDSSEAELFSSKALLRILLAVASVVRESKGISPDLQKKKIDGRVAKLLLRGGLMGRAYRLDLE